MLFTTFSYVLFLPAVCLLYYLLPHRFRWILLLAASYFFYGCWSVKYTFLMLTSTAITFASGVLIDRVQQKGGAQMLRRKRWLVALSFIANLSILMLFKYYGFLTENFQAVMDALGIALHLPDFSRCCRWVSPFIPSRRSAIRWMSTAAVFPVSIILENMHCLSLSSRSWWQALLSAPPIFSRSLRRFILRTRRKSGMG